MPYSTIPTILGVSAAGVLLYATNAAFKDQTQFMVAKMDRDVDAFDQVSDFDKTTGKRMLVSPRSVYQPLKPTYWEEVQGRWNVCLSLLTQRYVVDIMHTLRNANPLGNTDRSEHHQFVSDETQTAMLEALHTLAPHAPDAQPKIGILHRKYGDENTHYMGQGVSLR
ncbi:hypothetical protein MPSI1_001021 [Malassezia psittaci]|uniref:Altered inheritance of mitochondria protein 5, mitochondrial n=1 Tax=Malassezia psittaci TaxID=1821823 RepID=A0AAF0F995_9BASI|nr:hypothetical protein MPSI1_001021 [Malassezia psittaci]